MLKDGAIEILNFGNLFIDFKNGNVLICDNDNAVPDRSEISEIGGTLRFMAPEIVLGTAKTLDKHGPLLFSYPLILRIQYSSSTRRLT